MRIILQTIEKRIVMHQKAFEFEQYDQLQDEACAQRIIAAKNILGKRAVILAHHYQCDQIVAQADAVGDSFALSRRASETEAKFIVFCGVHFMAETADLLKSADQKVFLPNVDAGCPLAEMANIENVKTAWGKIQALTGDPVSYTHLTLPTIYSV